MWVTVVACLLLQPAISASCEDQGFVGSRIECGYAGITAEQCQARGCCWKPAEIGSARPWCYRAPSEVPGYEVTSFQKTSNGYVMDLVLLGPTEPQFGEDINHLKVLISFETKDRFHIKIIDADKRRWEIPESVLSLPPDSGVTEDQANFEFSYTNKPFTFTVKRKSDGTVLFDSSTTRSLIYKDLYLEISNKIPQDANIYGLGERVHDFRLDPSEKTYTMFSIDTPTPTDQNLYGVHPFYLEMRHGKAHGVFLKNSNAQEVLISKNRLVYYLTGGVLDFYVFNGPTPESVAKQYHEVIGKPYMPPFWALGWHQCRYGFASLDEVKTVVQRYDAAGIPLDTIWLDIDFMDKYKDFTWDEKNFALKDVQEYLQYLHNRDQRMVLMVDPGIHNLPGYSAWDDGLEMDIFVKNSKGNVFIGRVWPGSVGFPDFFHPNASEYWQKQLSRFLDETPADGIWIDMNEASNFCSGECAGASSSVLNNPPYKINNNGYTAPLNTKTLDMDAVHYGGILEYNVHSLFGHTEGIATRRALEKYYNKRSFVLSRSTFAGSGHHVAHWLGDNHSTFQSMRDSIPGALAMNMFGIPFVGADICGFTNTASEQLCARWHAFGAFFPFARNHNSNDEPDQYPYTWESVKKITVKSLKARYSLLAYYYTLFYQVHTQGGLVMKPLFFAFPEKSETLLIDRQFLIGDSILISPNLFENSDMVDAYFPPGAWYDFWTYTRQWTSGKWTRIPAALDEIPIHIRGGSVIPRQVPALNTVATRKSPFEIVFALDAVESAKGQLYLDDGESLDVGKESTIVEFRATPRRLSSSVKQDLWSGAKDLTIQKFSVLGIYKQPSAVSVNGQPVSFNYTDQGTLFITGLNLPINKDFIVTWRETTAAQQ